MLGNYYEAASINATTTFALRAVNSWGSSPDGYVTVRVIDPLAFGVAITSPLAGDTISKPFALVEGLVANGGAEVGVTVNGIPAQVVGNTFFVNNLSLTEGENTLTAGATDPNGNSVQDSLTVTSNSTGKEWLELSLNPESGIADPTAIPAKPFTATLKVTPHLSNSSTAWGCDGFGYDYIGYGTSENPVTYASSYNGDCFEEPLLFSDPGIYKLHYSLTDVSVANGQNYTGEIWVNVLDKEGLDSVLRQQWNNVKTAWAAHDVEGGLAYFAEGAKSHYRGALNALVAELPQIVSEMQDIELVSARGRYAEYRLNRLQNINGTMVDMTYYIYFVKDHTGLWKVDQF